MRSILSCAALLLALSGCQVAALRSRTLDQASSASDYYYLQVLNNIAQQSVNPAAIPYFTDPKTQQTTIQRQLQATYTPGWDFITSGAYIGRYLFDKQTAAIQGSENTAEGWQAATSDNPDKLVLMRAVYHQALGLADDIDTKLISTYYGTYPKYRSAAAATGWFRTSAEKHDVPRHACYVGHCGPCYVWVPDECREQFSQFTLAILDIATIDLKPSRVAHSLSPGEVLLSNPREQYFMPFSLQSPPPTQ